MKDQSSMPVPAFVYKNEVKLKTLMIKAHLFFTDKGIFLTNDNLQSDFFSYDSILKIDINKTFITSGMELYFKPESIPNQAMDMIDFPLNAKAAERKINLKNDLAKYIVVNDISKK